jgi:hypothetical protein
MDNLRKRLLVSGRAVTLKPYTEKRMRDLLSINKEISEFIEQNPDKTFEQIATQRAEWWMRKAEVLWEFDVPTGLSFFEDENFEMGLLKQCEEDFFLNRNYL